MKHTLAKLRQSQYVTIVAVGDSNTTPTFHTRGFANWTQLLAEALFETYGNGLCNVINSSQCGSSVRRALEFLDRDVLRFQPDLAILSMGMNDSTRGVDYLPAFRDEVRQFVASAREKGIEVLIRTPNPVVGPHGVPLPNAVLPGRPLEYGTRKLADYAATLVELGRELDCSVCDHYSLWSNHSVPFKHGVANPNHLWGRMSDAIHPGPQGHLAFFRELAPFFDVAPRFPWEEP